MGDDAKLKHPVSLETGECKIMSDPKPAPNFTLVPDEPIETRVLRTVMRRVNELLQGCFRTGDPDRLKSYLDDHDLTIEMLQFEIKGAEPMLGERH